MFCTFIIIILDRSQIDAGSLIQVETNEKALGRIREKIVRARSTVDWLRSNNILCSVHILLCLLCVFVFFCVLMMFCSFIVSYGIVLTR